MTDPIPRPRRPRVWRAVGCAFVIAFIALGGLGFFALREMAIASACGECPQESPPDEPTPVPRVSLGEPRGGVQQLALGGEVYPYLRRRITPGVAPRAFIMYGPVLNSLVTLLRPSVWVRETRRRLSAKRRRVKCAHLP